MDLLKSILILILISSYLFSNEDLTINKKSVLILAPQQNSENLKISKSLTNILAAKSIELGRFNVIDRNQVKVIMEEQKLQASGMVSDKDIVEIGELASADDALLINIITFDQQGVPKKKKKDEDEDEDSSLIEWVIKTSIKSKINTINPSMKYPNNIQTILQIEIRMLNIETGISSNSFQISSEYTGGTKKASLKKTFEKISWQISKNLRSFYLISSEVIEKNGDNIIILTGRDLGLEEGNIFEINSLDREKTYKNRTIKLPGKSRGLARLIAIGPSTSEAIIIRDWRTIKPGYKVNEMIYDPTAIDLNIKSISDSNFALQLKYWPSRLKKFSNAATIQIGSLRDSRGYDNPFVELGWETNLSILKLKRLKFLGGFSIPFGYIINRDDDGNSVYMLTSNCQLKLGASILTNEKTDIFFDVYYSIANSKSKIWRYNKIEEDDQGNEVSEQISAFWDSRGAPSIMRSKISISLGVRFFDY